MDHIPSISKVFSYVVQQERQIMGNTLPSESELRINAANAQLVCSFCGKHRHVESNCYRKNGFPPSHDGKNFNKNNASKKICSHCGKNGHTIEVCYRKHGFPLDINSTVGRATQSSPLM